MKALIFGFVSLALVACATAPEVNKPVMQNSVTSVASPSVTTPPKEPLLSYPEHVSPEPTTSVILAQPKSYPPIVYGAHKPLVCSREYQAENELENRPNLQVMWEHYLYDSPKGVWAEVGGTVEVNGCLPEDQGGWRNACTVRLSHMLNKAGHKIPYTKEQTVSGKDGSQYFFRLTDMHAYLEEVMGPADLDFKEAAGHWIDIPNRPGLLISKFPGSNFTGHATIWNGAGTVDGTDVVGFRVLYWRLPCFIPEDRTLTPNEEHTKTYSPQG